MGRPEDTDSYHKHLQRPPGGRAMNGFGGEKGGPVQFRFTSFGFPQVAPIHPDPVDWIGSHGWCHLALHFKFHISHFTFPMSHVSFHDYHSSIRNCDVSSIMCRFTCNIRHVIFHISKLTSVVFHVSCSMLRAIVNMSHVTFDISACFIAHLKLSCFMSHV